MAQISRPPIHEPRTGPLGPAGTAAPRRPTEVREAVHVRRSRHLTSRRRWDIIVIGLLLVVGALVATPWVRWYRAAPVPSALVVVSKTVPRERWLEHAGLFWWLDHARRVRPDGATWNERRDYVGYDPVARQGALLDDARLTGARLLYLADAYGVYVADLQETDSAPDPSRLIYGGITSGEAAAIARFRARGGAVVAEFNTLESPTAGTPAEAALTRVLGARYDRWVARWFRDLDAETDVSNSLRERWRRQAGAPWAFDGEGLVFLSEADDRMLVVTADRFAGPRPVTLEVDLPDDPLVRQVRTGTAWWQWMAGVTPTDSGLVLASFALHLDAEGEAMVRAAGFPLRFPAIVRHRAPPLAAYLAGDFAELTLPPRGRRTVGLDDARAWLARTGRVPRGDLGETLWNASIPLWEAMAREAGM